MFRLLAQANLSPCCHYFWFLLTIDLSRAYFLRLSLFISGFYCIYLHMDDNFDRIKYSENNLTYFN